jgi:hypothetical protein
VFENIINQRRTEVDFSYKRGYQKGDNKITQQLEYLVVCKMILVDEIYALMKLICLN